MLLRVIGAVQLILGALYLFVPMQFLALMGHSVPAADVAYPLGMLAARFLAYSMGMFYIARAERALLDRQHDLYPGSGPGRRRILHGDGRPQPPAIGAAHVQCHAVYPPAHVVAPPFDAGGGVGG